MEEDQAIHGNIQVSQVSVTPAWQVATLQNLGARPKSALTKWLPSNKCQTYSGRLLAELIQGMRATLLHRK